MRHVNKLDSGEGSAQNSVDDRWLQEASQANLYFPQFFHATASAVALSLLETKPVTLESVVQFTNSELTLDQKRLIAERGQQGHDAYRIPFTFETVREVGAEEQSITSEQLDVLWSTYTLHALKLIVALWNVAMPEYRIDTARITPQSGKPIIRALRAFQKNDPRIPEGIEMIKSLLKTIQATLYNREGVEIAKQVREGLSQGLRRPELNHLALEMDRLIVEALLAASLDLQVKQRIEEEFSNRHLPYIFGHL